MSPNAATIGEFGADRDRGRRDRAGEREQKTELDGDQAVEPRRADEADRDDRQADGREHVPEQPVATIHEQGTGTEAHRAADQADDDARLGPDPTAGEGQAQEEDGAEDEREATDPREGAAGQACLEVGQGDGHARLGRRPLRFLGGTGRLRGDWRSCLGDARVAASQAGSPVAVAGAAAVEAGGGAVPREP